MVATSVAEEGIDIQACSLVVRLEPPATVIGMIQSRGRARYPGSQYVVLSYRADDQACVAETAKGEQHMLGLMEAISAKTANLKADTILDAAGSASMAPSHARALQALSTSSTVPSAKAMQKINVAAAIDPNAEPKGLLINCLTVLLDRAPPPGDIVYDCRQNGETKAWTCTLTLKSMLSENGTPQTHTVEVPLGEDKRAAEKAAAKMALQANKTRFEQARAVHEMKKAKKAMAPNPYAMGGKGKGKKGKKGVAGNGKPKKM